MKPEIQYTMVVGLYWSKADSLAGSKYIHTHEQFL